MNTKPTYDYVVVTYLYDGQVGLAVYEYRIRALSKLGSVLVIARHTLKHAPEFAGIAFDELVIPARTTLGGYVGYLRKVRREISRLSPKNLILLGAQSSPLATTGTPSAIYWNEHPEHFVPREGRLLTAPLRAIVRNAVYAGARQARVVMPIGPRLADDLRENGVREDRLRVVPMGVAQLFEPKSSVPVSEQRAPRELRLIYTGHVSRERGRDVMIEGVAAALRLGAVVRLDIYGANEEQIQFCTERCKALGVDGAVNVNSRVPSKEIPPLVQNADFGVCLWENRRYYHFNPPTKLFEYLVAGVPVIASRIPTHTDYVVEGENGYVFDYNPEHLGAAIHLAWSKLSELPRLKQNALTAGAPYRWAQVHEEFVSAILLLAPQSEAK